MVKINIFLGNILLIVSKEVKREMTSGTQRSTFFIILTNLFVLAKCAQVLHICISDNAKINRVIAAIIPHLGRPRCASIYLLVPTSVTLIKEITV